MVLHTGNEKSSDHAEGSLIQIRLLTRASKMRKELVALFCSIHDYQDSNSRRGGGGGDEMMVEVVMGTEVAVVVDKEVEEEMHKE